MYINFINCFYTFIENIDMLSIQQIQYILALVEQGNFSRAAEHSFVTQPTLSMQIKKAEEIIGFAIFDRHRNPVELTPLGEKLIPILQDIQENIHRIEYLKGSLTGEYQEEIRLGIIPTIAPYLVPRLFDDWQKQLPSVRLVIQELKTEDLLDAIHSRKIDYGIFAGPHEDVSMQFTPLYMEEIQAYCPTCDTDKLEMSQLKNLRPWLLSQGNCLRTQMMQLCELSNENETDWNYEGGNIEMLVRMVDVKGGYTLVPVHYNALLNRPSDQFIPIENEISASRPARMIMGVALKKNRKWESIRPLVHFIQLEFNDSTKNSYQVLSWK